jgi:exopolyphosphatase/guanosine-5'-triphosphate,3'-diphosphate pyrophosphatase
MRLAAIDIGTNSVHMIIVRVRPDFSFEVVDREKEMVRLGAGGLDGKKMTHAAMTAALQALSKFERLARSHEVDEILAVATSATREAENGGEFLAAIERTTGIRPRIITGTEEARLIHSAAVYGVETPKQAVVIDIGGGSVEITRGSGQNVQFARSFKIGVIRLTERFVTSDPLSGRDERKLVKYIDQQVEQYVRHINTAGYDRVIGTSGTILSLGTVATAIDREDVPNETRNLRVSSKSIRRLRKVVTELDLEERMHLPGLDPRRADLMVAGVVLLDTLLKRLKADEITLCDLALREGLVLEYIRKHRSEIARVDRYPDVRRRSTIELAERCNWEEKHSRQVARLALAMFDQSRKLHGLGDLEREWLEYASLLHDLGNHISYQKHHRHSYYLVKNGDLRGFEPEEIEVMALITRYHRRAAPQRGHPGYEELDRPMRRAVKVLSAFLRMAESLDRSRNQVVKKVDLRVRYGQLRLDVYGKGDSELEVWAANRQLETLAAALKQDIKLHAHHLTERDEPVRRRRPARSASDVATPVRKPKRRRSTPPAEAIH